MGASVGELLMEKLVDLTEEEYTLVKGLVDRWDNELNASIDAMTKDVPRNMRKQMFAEWEEAKDLVEELKEKLK
jgi:hypothetical protein